MILFLLQIYNFLSIENIFFEVLHYPVSYIEFAGTLTGLISVYLAARSNIFTWPTGLINVTCFFVIFYQVQLYSDMFLQVYFFIISIYGWYVWNKQNKEAASPIKLLSNKQRYMTLAIMLGATIAIGAVVANIHLMLPAVFAKEAAFPYLDTFIAVMSIIATMFLARRILETWALWIAVDILSTGLYGVKGVMLISIEYFIFLCIAAVGFFHWRKLLNDEDRFSVR